jgi:hypothetical protein
MTAAVVAFAVLLQQLSPPRPAAAAGDTGAGRPCKVAIDSVGRQAQRVVVRPGETNVFAGGGVLAHCEGTGSTLAADSVAWFAGVGRFDMIGRTSPVHIRDTAVTLDAVTAAYYLRQERLEAHNAVVAVNRRTGSVLRGPNLTYYRAAAGVRDTAEMYASGRPTIAYHAAGDSGEPYIIVADRVRLKGDDRLWGGGRVTIDRSDFAARGDSVHLDETAGFGVLVGRPRVEGRGARAYTLAGTRIELGLAGREVRLVKALGDAAATGADWRLTADTIHLALAHGKLQQAFAWGPRDSARARALSARTTIRADSLALDAPDEVLSEVRAFGHALSTSRRDTSDTAAVNWIAGDTLVAAWAPAPDSSAGSGAPPSRLRRITARGGARALTHLYPQGDSAAAGPSVNYSRGTAIDIALQGERIDRVLVTGAADGVHLEPLPPPADSAAKRPPPPR